ncbi:MAG: GGDEF domain-containing protein [Deltaproteobacteria bacterium]|jgi:diguanylate cyclase (GGDEF)-like protein|nr:GGDEF domain-containing protein [Deltaproteobacteria bacterium]
MSSQKTKNPDDALERERLKTQDGELSLKFLRVMEFAILKRVRPMVYEFYGLAPDFYNRLFPMDPGGAPCSAPWKYSSMLEYFLLDAEDFFERNPRAGEKVNSGIWLEPEGDHGVELPLVAKAWQINKQEQIISVQVIHEEYAERVNLLRKARMELVERRKISNDLNNFKKQALYDGMTKLYNRASFMDIIQEQIDKLRTYAPTLALFIIDVDNFKIVNDTLGHLVGDSVLVQVADLLRTSLRKNDYPARYGGDEFTVVAPDTNIEQSHKLAEKLRHRVQSHKFNTGNIPVTISVGYTIYRSGETVQNFIRRSDLALYDAKLMGRNVACFRDPWIIEDDEISDMDEAN